MSLTADEELLEAVDLAIAQAKRVEREARISKQQLARIRERLQPGGHKENESDTRR